MSSSKTVTARYDTVVFTTTINPTMNETDIYEALRAPLSAYIGTYHIAITKPSGELAHLSFRDLTTKVVYNITTSTEQVQGAPSSGPPKSVLNNLAIITGHWNLVSAADIFPPQGGFNNMGIAPRTRNAENALPTISDTFDTPLLNPEGWPARFTDELRKLSSRTQGRHGDALAMVGARVSARWES